MVVVSSNIPVRLNELFRQFADALGTSRDALIRQWIREKLAPLIEADGKKPAQES